LFISLSIGVFIYTDGSSGDDGKYRYLPTQSLSTLRLTIGCLPVAIYSFITFSNSLYSTLDILSGASPSGHTLSQCHHSLAGYVVYSSESKRILYIFRSVLFSFVVIIIANGSSLSVYYSDEECTANI